MTYNDAVEATNTTQMAPFPQIYEEGKLLPCVAAIAISAVVFISAHLESVPLLPIVWIPFALLGFIYFYPKAIIVLYEDHMEYKNGSVSWSSPWSEVTGLYAVNNIAVPAHPNIPYRVVVETKNGTTKIIETRFLRLRGQNFFANTIFAGEVSRLSGAQMIPGDPSVRKYGAKVFYAYIAVYAFLLTGLVVFYLYR